MVRIVRVMIAETMEKNPNLMIGGQQLHKIVQLSRKMSLEDYIDKVVLTQGEDASDVIYGVTPIAFRISLNIVVFDSQDETFVSPSCLTQQIDRVGRTTISCQNRKFWVHLWR